jgi:hypothetical protein
LRLCLPRLRPVALSQIVLHALPPASVVGVHLFPLFTRILQFLELNVLISVISLSAPTCTQQAPASRATSAIPPWASANLLLQGKAIPLLTARLLARKLYILSAIGLLCGANLVFPEILGALVRALKTAERTALPHQPCTNATLLRDSATHARELIARPMLTVRIPTARFKVRAHGLATIILVISSINVSPHVLVRHLLKLWVFCVELKFSPLGDRVSTPGISSPASVWV